MTRTAGWEHDEPLHPEEAGPHSLEWTPGQWGKALWYPSGHVVSWNVDDNSERGQRGNYIMDGYPSHSSMMYNFNKDYDRAACMLIDPQGMGTQPKTADSQLDPVDEEAFSYAAQQTGGTVRGRFIDYDGGESKGGSSVNLWVHTAQDGALVIGDIAAWPSGTGRGSQVVRALQQYAQQHGRQVRLLNVTNPGYWKHMGIKTATPLEWQFGSQDRIEGLIDEAHDSAADHPDAATGHTHTDAHDQGQRGETGISRGLDTDTEGGRVQPQAAQHQANDLSSWDLSPHLAQKSDPVPRRQTATPMNVMTPQGAQSLDASPLDYWDMTHLTSVPTPEANVTHEVATPAMRNSGVAQGLDVATVRPLPAQPDSGVRVAPWATALASFLTHSSRAERLEDNRGQYEYHIDRYTGHREPEHTRNHSVAHAQGVDQAGKLARSTDRPSLQGGLPYSEKGEASDCAVNGQRTSYQYSRQKESGGTTVHKESQGTPEQPGPWRVQDADVQPEQSYLNDAVGYDHSPWLADPKTRTILVGQPGVHHGDLAREFGWVPEGIEPGYENQMTWPEHAHGAIGGGYITHTDGLHHEKNAMMEALGEYDPYSSVYTDPDADWNFEHTGNRGPTGSRQATGPGFVDQNMPRRRDYPTENPTVQDWTWLGEPGENHGTNDHPYFWDLHENKLHLGPKNWYHEQLAEELASRDLPYPFDPAPGAFRRGASGRTSYINPIRHGPVIQALDDHGFRQGEDPDDWDFQYARTAAGQEHWMPIPKVGDPAPFPESHPALEIRGQLYTFDKTFGHYELNRRLGIHPAEATDHWWVTNGKWVSNRSVQESEGNHWVFPTSKVATGGWRIQDVHVPGEPEPGFGYDNRQPMLLDRENKIAYLGPLGFYHRHLKTPIEPTYDNSAWISHPTPFNAINHPIVGGYDHDPELYKALEHKFNSGPVRQEDIGWDFPTARVAHAGWPVPKIVDHSDDILNDWGPHDTADTPFVWHPEHGELHIGEFDGFHGDIEDNMTEQQRMRYALYGRLQDDGGYLMYDNIQRHPQLDQVFGLAQQVQRPAHRVEDDWDFPTVSGVKQSKNAEPWRPGGWGKAISFADGRVFTWPVSSRSPNGANGYHHAEYAKAVLGMQWEDFIDQYVGKQAQLLHIDPWGRTQNTGDGEVTFPHTFEGTGLRPSKWLAEQNRSDWGGGAPTEEDWHFPTAKTATWDQDAHESPYPEDMEPWQPGRLGKGLVSPEGRAYTWQIDENHGTDGYPSHSQAISAITGAQGSDSKVFDHALQSGWSFFTVHHDGSHVYHMGLPEHQEIMKAHLPQEPRCGGCGGIVHPDSTGFYKCPACRWAGDWGEGEADDWEFHHGKVAAVQVHENEHEPDDFWKTMEPVSIGFIYHAPSDTLHVGAHDEVHHEQLWQHIPEGYHGSMGTSFPGYVSHNQRAYQIWDQAEPEVHERVRDLLHTHVGWRPSNMDELEDENFNFPHASAKVSGEKRAANPQGPLTVHDYSHVEPDFQGYEGRRPMLYNPVHHELHIGPDNMVHFELARQATGDPHAQMKPQGWHEGWIGPNPERDVIRGSWQENTHQPNEIGWYQPVSRETHEEVKQHLQAQDETADPDWAFPTASSRIRTYKGV